MALMMAWLHSFYHLASLFGLISLYSILKGLDQLYEAIDQFHKDYRRVNNLDVRDEMEFQSRLP
jgi:hypothetical protein